jgi:uncharacterized protein YacL
MNISLAFMRIFFFFISLFLMTTYMRSIPGESMTAQTVWGLVIGGVFWLFLVSLDTVLKRFNLRSFNIVLLGLFFGYLMGQALVMVLDAIIDISAASIVLNPQTLEMIQIALFLFGTYLGTIMTLRSSDEIYVSIPFVKFAPMGQKKKDLLADASVLGDGRIIDLATSGMLDQALLIPRFVMKELYASAEVGDEAIKTRAKRALDSIKKLESYPDLGLRYNDTDFPEVSDVNHKLVRLARLLDANILSADISRVQMASIEGVRIINIHALSNALKPLMQTGEIIKIKVQRYGKEPRQGVGYLDDGTMVVINGGGDYIGEMVSAQVLSVKHTTSGRMIFCNIDENSDDNYEEYEDDDE